MSEGTSFWSLGLVADSLSAVHPRRHPLLHSAPAMSAQVRDRLTNGSLAQACLETLETFDV